MVCKNCGNQCEDGAKVCENCNTVLEPMPIYNASATVVNGPVPGKDLSVVGMILGIVSIILSCLCGGFLTLPIPIIGLVLSIISNKKAKEVGMKNDIAFAGIICSAIAIVIHVIVIIASVVMLLYVIK